VGGDSPERLLAMAERSFGRLEGEGAVPLAEPLPAAAADGEPHRVKLGASQGYLRTGALVEVRGPRERAALALAVGMLGATLFSTLRDRQGLAYTVGADLEFLGPYALVSAGLGAAPDALDRALSEVRRVIAARAAAPVSPEEVARRAKAIAGRLASRQLASAIRAYYLGAALFAGAPHRYGDDYAALLGSIRPEEVEEMQRRAFGRPFAAVLVE
jgi:predicted Zn-dependent peptidase